MSAWITRIEQHLGRPLVPDLRRLYAQSDGEAGEHGRPGPVSAGRPMRLMTADEVIETYDSFSGFVPLRGSALFWAGGNGEYAAVFLSGPLTGRVYIFDYDGRNDSVAFRSAGSFVASLGEAAAEGADWQDLRTDYYVDTEYFIRGDALCKPASEAETASDREAAALLRQEYATATIEDERDDHHYAMNIMALTPPAETASMLDFLDSDDMWIQERACNVVGHRKYEPVIAKLGTIARSGTTNGRGAALHALGRIGNAAALAEVLKSAPHFDRGAHYAVASALEACGCAVRKDHIDPRGVRTPDYLYQLPGETGCHKL